MGDALAFCNVLPKLIANPKSNRSDVVEERCVITSLAKFIAP